MKLIKEIHCHTVYSHGTGTIRDNVLAARDKGIMYIIISEHGMKHWFARKNNANSYLQMKKEILELRKEFPDMEIYLGIESNVISTKGDLDVDDEILDIIDILYCGIHLLSIPKNISTLFNMQIMNKLAEKFGWFRRRQIRINTNALISAINKYPVKMITHPDTRGPIDLLELARECEKKDVRLEINDTKSKINADDIKLIEQNNINITYAVGSDAHSSKDIGKCSNAIKILEESGINLNKVYNME